MNSEDLEKLVAVGDGRGLADAVASLSEVERQKLSKTARRLVRDLEQSRWDPELRSRQPLPRLDQFVGAQQAHWADQVRVAALALLAVGPLSAAKDFDLCLGRGHDKLQEQYEDLMVQVLRDRSPQWIDAWVTAILDREFIGIDWNTLWRLIQEGVCTKPTSEAYYRAMALTLPECTDSRSGQPILLSEVLAAEPELIEDMFQFFELETAAFSYDWGVGSKDTELWPAAIVKLAEQGHVDRDRLLDATLAGQTSGLKLICLSGFAKLHEQLVPTPDELAARQAVYCDLMSVPMTQVVSFAVKMIKKLDQAKRLDDESFVAVANRVFDVTTKGPPKSIVSVIKKLVKRRPDLVPEVSRALIDALNHSAEDVQAAALALLETLADRLDNDIVRHVADRLPDLPANIRPQAMALIKEAGSEIQLQADDDSELGELDNRFSDCRERAAALEPHWYRFTDIEDAVVYATEPLRWPSPFEFDVMQVPVLSGLEPVEPIVSLEELIDAVAHGIEKVDEAVEVERVIDGISRLCDQRPDDFDRRVAPLVKRIQKIKDSDSNRGMANQHAAGSELPRLLGVWLVGDADLARPSWGGGRRARRSVFDFIDQRMAVLRQRIAKAKPSPLLASPTHQRGWIAPAAIVQRWRDTEQGGSRPPRVEIVQALLRMAPEGRQEALNDAKPLTHRWARALCWALGGEEGPDQEAKEDADIWLAAGRARSPQGSLDELAGLGLSDAEPDGMRPAQYGWEARITEHLDNYHNKTVRYAKLHANVQPELGDVESNATGRPTVLMHCEPEKWAPYGTSATWLYDWVSMVWPARLSAFFMVGAQCMVGRLDEGSSNWEPNHAFMPPLFDVDRPWDDVTRLMVLIGMAGRDQDVRGLAIDALVEGIADGRVHPDTLGGTLSTLVQPYWLKLNRLSENMAEVARISPLHAWTVMGTLSQLLAQYEELPRDVHYLLTLLRELYAQFGLPPQESVLEKLRDVKGSSRTAKMAKALCKYQPEHPTNACQEARLMTLEARLDRAERWSEV